MSQPASVHPSKTTGHEGFPPTTTLSGSPNVNIEGKPALKKGIVCGPHTNPSGTTHPTPTISSGSSSVNINGQPATRIGDDVDCGDMIADGVSTVFIGG